MDKIKLLVIDNYTLFWEGFRYMDEYEKYFSIHTIDKFDSNFEQIASEFQADIVLMDMRILLENKRKVVRGMQVLGDDVKLAVISERTDNQLIEALDVEATGYLLRNMEYPYFIEALQTIRLGEFWYHPFMTGPFMKRCREMFPSERTENSLLSIPSFTKREYDVLNLLVKGYSNKMIADILNITSFTVNSHIRNILKKSNANDRTHAVVLAIEHNWLHVFDNKNPSMEEMLDEA